MNLLLNERPLILLPSLVKLVGFERAAIIQQIHWLLEQPRNGIEHEGHKWVWGTYEEWCEQYFSFWEPRTLRYHMDKLEKEEWVISAQLRKEEWDRTKYYRVNYKKFDASNGQCIDASTVQRVDASSYTETTTKTTKRGAKHLSPSPSPVEEKEAEPEDNYFGAVCWVLGRNTKTMSKAGREEVGKIVKQFQAAGYTLDDLRTWWTNVWLKDWRAKRGSGRPTAKQLRDEFVVSSTKDISNVIPNSRVDDTLPAYDPQVWEDINF